jgi:hypothetical protein
MALLQDSTEQSGGGIAAESSKSTLTADRSGRVARLLEDLEPDCLSRCPASPSLKNVDIPSAAPVPFSLKVSITMPDPGVGIGFVNCS